QPMTQRLDQHAPALRVIDQIVLQVGVALYDPDVPEDLIEHAGGAARSPFAAKLVENLPDSLAEQPHDDLAIRERSVVVRNFTQARGCFRNECTLRLDGLERKGQ